jgi:phosphoenolpyruvate carboxylase
LPRWPRLALLRDLPRRCRDGAGEVGHGHLRALLLVGRRGPRRVFRDIHDEFLRCRDRRPLAQAAGHLLQRDQRLAQSIRLRNPYVDPISLLQVDLLARWRDAGRPEDALFRALVATVNGIAAGVQNTG